jgi:RNA-binding protein 39
MESKGFGFVSFEKVEEAKLAIDKMNGFAIEGKLLRVQIKSDKTDSC